MKLRTIYALAAAVVLAVGCGGNGASTGTSPTDSSTSGSLSLFATDNLIVGYDHVWVTIQKIELVAASGNKVVMDDSKGRVVDLLSLRDPAGRRFALLTNHAINRGTFSGIKVTLQDALSIFPTNAKTATEAKFDGATGGQKVISINFPAPKDITPGSNLIVDFDLANWDLSGGMVSSKDGNFLKIVEDATIGDVDRHERDEYRGSVSALSGTAPNQTFTLTQGPSTITVKTSDKTTIFNADSSPSPSLANGKQVEVYGAYSKTDNALVATKVKIGAPAEQGKDKQVRGKITSFTVASNTLTIDLKQCENHLPTTSSVTVNYADTALFFGNRGTKLTVAEFEAALAKDGYIEAEGAVVDGVVTAAKLKLEDGKDREDDPKGNPGRADVAGSPTAVNATALTFSVKAEEWEGTNSGANQLISVKTDDKTKFGINGKDATATQAYAELAKGTKVKVSGQFDPATKVITAVKVGIGAGGGKDDNGGGKDDNGGNGDGKDDNGGGPNGGGPNGGGQNGGGPNGGRP